MRAMKATIRWPAFWLAPAPKNPKSRHQSKVGNKESAKGLYVHTIVRSLGPFFVLVHLTRNHHLGVTWMRAPGLASPSIHRGLLPHRGCGGHIHSAALAPPL